MHRLRRERGHQPHRRRGAAGGYRRRGGGLRGEQGGGAVPAPHPQGGCDPHRRPVRLPLCAGEAGGEAEGPRHLQSHGPLRRGSGGGADRPGKRQKMIKALKMN